MLVPLPVPLDDGVEVVVGAKFGWSGENTPPPTLDDVVEFIELDAASAYAARVSPLSLSSVGTYSTYRTYEVGNSSKMIGEETYGRFTTPTIPS